MIREKYPLLHHYLTLFTIENGLDLEQIRGIILDAKAAKPELGVEIDTALADSSLSWQAILDDPNVGEIYSTESEESAFQYARQMFIVD